MNEKKKKKSDEGSGNLKKCAYNKIYVVTHFHSQTHGQMLRDINRGEHAHTCNILSAWSSTDFVSVL